MNKNIEPILLGGIGDMKSNGGTQWFFQDRIYDSENGIALALTTSINPMYAVKEREKMEETLKTELCNKLVKNGLVEEGDVIKHSYTQQILDGNETSGTLLASGNQNGIIEEDTKLRIRKLTGKECYRLMGFEDIDYERAKEVIPESMIYHTAGDSIVVNVLEAIFKEMI